MPDFLKAALEYAALGWHIFPLAPKTKIPLYGSNGVKDATNDEKKIRQWWEKEPSANIGLACGDISGVTAIDVDLDLPKGINGYDSLKAYPELPKTVCQSTPRGGFHAIYKSNDKLFNIPNFANGISIRHSGYYIVLSPSVHPNGGQYHWSKALSPKEYHCENFPEFIKCVQKSIAVPWEKPQQLTEPTNDVIERAKAYLNECEPAIQGQGGHSKLLWAANTLVNGFLLPDNTVYDLLANEYNPRCNPPWNLNDKKDYKDFTRKISEARKNGSKQQLGWLITDKKQEFTKLDIPSLLRQSLKENGNTKKPNIDIEYLIHPPGLTGELCDWINKTSLKYQPILTLGCVLAFLGTLFGRKVRDYLGSRTNIYCMGVAKSSRGKNHAISQIRNICHVCGCTGILGGESVASDTAIEDRICRIPSTLFLWDEVGHFLSNVKSGLNKNYTQVVSLLMKLYSSAGSIYVGKEYADNSKQRLIIQPCCCIYGVSSPERFSNGLSPTEIHDGWLARCLVFYSSSDPDKHRERVNVELPENVKEKIRYWFTKNTTEYNGNGILDSFITAYCDAAPPDQILVETNEDAEKTFREFDKYTRYKGKENPFLECIFAKGEENARRIALIVATGCNTEQPIITQDIAKYSCELIKYLLSDFETIIAPEISGNTIEKNKREVVNVIERQGLKGMNKSDITRLTRWADRRVRDNILSDLIESGDIVFTNTKDNKQYRYWTVNTYQNYLKEK